MWTEERIKRELDGCYWFFDHDGHLHFKPVPADYIPSHDGRAAFVGYGNLAGVNVAKQVDWPSNAIEIMTGMRDDSLSWSQIGAVFGCSGTSASKYYQREMRRMEREREDDETGHASANRKSDLSGI